MIMLKRKGDCPLPFVYRKLKRRRRQQRQQQKCNRFRLAEQQLLHLHRAFLDIS